MAVRHSPEELRLQLVQMRPRKARVDENLAMIRERIAEGAEGADIILFPETVLTGYIVEGGVVEGSRTLEEVADGLGAAPDGAPDVVIGFYEREHGSHFNSVAYFTPDGGRYRALHCHRKVFLPTYGIFDESRFVSPGLSFEAFDTRFGRLGLLVCEELFHSIAPSILALDGAELLLAVSASPGRDHHPGSGRPGNLEMWDVTGRAIALEHGVHLAVTHLVGSEGGKIFPGGSSVYGPGGTIELHGPVFEEAVLPVTISLDRGRRERRRSPLLADLRTMVPHLVRSLERAVVPPAPGSEGPPVRSGGPAAARDDARAALPDPQDRSFLEIDPELLERALRTFLRDEVVERRGMRDVVVGVSGGVDSAVTLLLATRAFGPEHVHAFLLPYATSSPESLEHGELILEAAGVNGRVIEITDAVDAYAEAHEAELSDRRRGNLAARFRAMVLFDQSARVGGIPLGTGNKSERLLGYFTWHADDSPPVNPLGDLYKTQILALARHLGVPEAVVSKAPSADLVEGVHDEDELGVSYEVADPILHWLLHDIPAEALVEAGFAEAAVEVVRSRLEGTHWKRKLPTVAVVSSSAIGEFYLRPVDY